MSGLWVGSMVFLVGVGMDDLQGIRNDNGSSYKGLSHPPIGHRIHRKGGISATVPMRRTVPLQLSCQCCLAGETEVITPSGAKPIRDLLGNTTVLVPDRRSGWASWQDVDVCSFGVQRLRKIKLRRERSVKVIYATPEHRWVTKDTLGCYQPFKPTTALQPGDVIPSSWRKTVTASRHEVVPSPFGIAHGFVYGDGNVQSQRPHVPASVILHGEKDKVMLPFFALCNPREVRLPSGKTGIYVYNLPRQRKQEPPLTESRAYLLGWLAGYFAADGHVSKKGQAVIYSSRRQQLAFVRDVCYLMGIQTSPIARKDRTGFNGREPLHMLTLYARDLPPSFWLHQHHKERVLAHQSETRERRRDWIVESVEETNRVEEVFCAVVRDREMFVLADNVITGNCPFPLDARLA